MPERNNPGFSVATSEADSKWSSAEASLFLFLGFLLAGALFYAVYEECSCSDLSRLTGCDDDILVGRPPIALPIPNCFLPI